MISTKANANVKCLQGNLLCLGETYYFIGTKKTGKAPGWARDVCLCLIYHKTGEFSPNVHHKASKTKLLG